MGILLLVRHGQASFGSFDYDRLSAAGIGQARILGTSLSGNGLTPTKVVRGSLRRHRETAAAVAEGGGWEIPATEDADWDEFDHLAVMRGAGFDPEQLTDRRAFQAAFDTAADRWHAAADGRWPEQWTQFADRAVAALDRAAAEASGKGEVVLVISSAGPIAAAFACLTGAERRLPFQLWRQFNTVMVNTGLTRILVGASGPRVLSFNEHQHLDAGRVTYR